MYQIFVWRVLQPFPLLWLFLGLALFNLWRKRTESRRRLLLVTLPYLLLTLISVPVTGDWIVRSLEWQYPPLLERPGEAQAIVVLASYVYPPAITGDVPEPDESTCSRCLKAAELYHQGKTCPVIVSGASSDPHGVNCAACMREFLQKLGVRAEDLIEEGDSLTTYANAVESCKLLEARRLSRIILVTDATHLKRAVGCFRKQGVEVIPCGCQYRRPADFEFTRFLPQPRTAMKCQLICHEWLGLAWYWLQGKI